jgi:peptide/nickel transport system permease protein
VVAVGIAGIPRFARIVRGVTLSVRESGYVEAERAAGASASRILFRNVLPNVLAPIIVLSTLQIGSAILETASLGFFGLGVQPPTPEWGTMLSEGREFMRQAPWVMLFPGGLLFLAVISTNLVGDYVREALDPRLGGF